MHELSHEPKEKTSFYSGINSLNSTLNATQNSLLLSKNFQSAVKQTNGLKG